MAGLMLTYFLCLISGVCIESRWSLNSLLERVLMVFTLAAGQLLLGIQYLSLMAWLTGPRLIGVNVLFTLLFVGLSRLWPRANERLSWKTLLTKTWQGLAVQRRETLVLAFLAIALVSIVVYCSLGAWMIPLGDSYHFERPVFWIQNCSIAPFPVNNPRINMTSFVGEALALPGYMFFHTGTLYVVITFLASILALGIVFSVARRLGCSAGASLCAAAMTTGFTDFAVTFLLVRDESYLAGMWAGASLLFLINSRPTEGFAKPPLTQLGCSVFCFLMACGAKNTIFLLAPLYLIALVVTLRGFLFKRRAILTLALGGGIGLFCSGVLWNYVNNKLWYGDARGPQLMQDHLSRDFGLRSVWTRLSRGAVLVVFDTVWVPKSARKAYADACEKAVELLGGQKQLRDGCWPQAVPGQRTIRRKPGGISRPEHLSCAAVCFWIVRDLSHSASLAVHRPGAAHAGLFHSGRAAMRPGAGEKVAEDGGVGAVAAERRHVSDLRFEHGGPAV
jgi:hypothetical protein